MFGPVTLPPSSYLQGVERKIVSCQPSVTILVKRIPANISQEGIENLFRSCDLVLSVRLVSNKGGSVGVRGLNFAFVTFGSPAAADQAIKLMNGQPPLNLELSYTREEEDRLGFHDRELTDMEADITQNTNMVDVLSPEGPTEIKSKPAENEKVIIDEEDDKTNKMSTEAVTSKTSVFTFGSPLLIDLPPGLQDLGQCGHCGQPSMVVCCLCLAGYCSLLCQVRDWPRHKVESVVCARGGVESTKEGAKEEEILDEEAIVSEGGVGGKEKDFHIEEGKLEGPVDFTDHSTDPKTFVGSKYSTDETGVVDLLNNREEIITADGVVGINEDEGKKLEIEVNEGSIVPENSNYSTEKIGAENTVEISENITIPLPVTWTRLTRVVACETVGQMMVELETGEQALVRMAGVELEVPWSQEVREVLMEILADGEKGTQQFWVKRVGWEGEVQLVEIRDGEQNDIATDLVKMEIMRKADASESCQNIMASVVPRLQIKDNSLVRLLDIGDRSDHWRVRNVKQCDRGKLETVLLACERSQHLRQPPSVGQLVVAAIQFQSEVRQVRAEVRKVNLSTQQAKVQCLDYPQHKVLDFSNLFDPPPSCLSVPALCRLVRLVGVPSRPKKDVLGKLEELFPLRQDLRLHLLEEGGDNVEPVVELVDQGGISINRLLCKCLEVVTTSSDDLTKEKVDDEKLASQQADIKNVNLSDIASYYALPLNKMLKVVVLHVEKNGNFYVCQADVWEQLKTFQCHLQDLQPEMWPVPDKVQPSQLLVAKSRQDEAWYRVVVIKEYPASSSVKIYCPDYGFIEKLPTSNTRLIPSQDLAQKKLFASRCSPPAGELQVLSMVRVTVLQRTGVVNVVRMVPVQSDVEPDIERMQLNC